MIKIIFNFEKQTLKIFEDKILIGSYIGKDAIIQAKKILL